MMDTIASIKAYFLVLMPFETMLLPPFRVFSFDELYHPPRVRVIQVPILAHGNVMSSFLNLFLGSDVAAVIKKGAGRFFLSNVPLVATLKGQKP